MHSNSNMPSEKSLILSSRNENSSLGSQSRKNGKLMDLKNITKIRKARKIEIQDKYDIDEKGNILENISPTYDYHQVKHKN